MSRAWSCGSNSRTATCRIHGPSPLAACLTPARILPAQLAFGTDSAGLTVEAEDYLLLRFPNQPESRY